MRRSIIINFIAKYSNVLVQLILTIILARLVTPEEFGIIAVMTVFITFFNILGDIGVAPAIVQYKQLNAKNFSDIFIFMVAVALLLSTTFLAFSYLIAIFYKNSIYINVGHLLCFSIFFTLLSAVPYGILLRNKNFGAIGISSVSSNIVSGIIAIILAFNSFGVYALVYNSIFQSIFNFIMLFKYSHLKIIWNKKFEFSSISQIKKFSFYQFLFNLVNYFTRNLDNLIIGKFLGAQQLGFYDKSYRLMLYPIQGLTFVVTPVLQPYLSDYQNDKDKIYNYYVSIVKILFLIGVFITAICFFSARDIINLLFGSNWSGSINSFRILSLSISLQMILSSTGAIFQATNSTNYLFRTGLISFICFTILGFIGVLVGKSIEWVSILLVFGFVLNFIQGYYILVKKVFNRTFWTFLSYLMSPLLIEIILFAAFFAINIDFKNSFINILLKTVYGLLVYIILLYLTKDIKYIKRLLSFKRSKDK